MSDLKQLFEQAQIDIKTLSAKPSDDDMLALYSIYKQATDGDVTGDRPGFFDFVHQWFISSECNCGYSVEELCRIFGGVMCHTRGGGRGEGSTIGRSFSPGQK